MLSCRAKFFFLLLFDLCYYSLTLLQGVICIINAYLSVCVCISNIYVYNLCTCIYAYVTFWRFLSTEKNYKKT